jgi:hypothetical protein
MSVVVSVVVATAKFLYHYVVGDDPVVAIVIVLALAGTGVLVSNGINAWGLVPLLAIVMTGVSLRRRGVGY